MCDYLGIHVYINFIKNNCIDISHFRISLFRISYFRISHSEFPIPPFSDTPKRKILLKST